MALLIAGITGEADRNHDGCVTASELGSFLEDKVTNYSRNTQTSQYGKIRDLALDKGDFVFELDTPSTSFAMDFWLHCESLNGFRACPARCFVEYATTTHGTLARPNATGTRPRNGTTTTVSASFPQPVRPAAGAAFFKENAGGSRGVHGRSGDGSTPRPF